MSIMFPGESAEYRAARDRLLEQEIGLRRATEAVAAARRGQGIGAALLARAVEEAWAAKLRAVALDVAFSNRGAMRFYGREGFASVSERRHPTARGLPAGGSIRMERQTSG